MKIRISKTVCLDGISHGLRGVLPRACLPAGEAVATPPADCASRGQGASYSLAGASGVSFLSADAHFAPLRREGGECCPATISAFVNEWIGPRPKPAPVVRDFTFKAVIGEPEW